MNRYNIEGPISGTLQSVFNTGLAGSLIKGVKTGNKASSEQVKAIESQNDTLSQIRKQLEWRNYTNNLPVAPNQPKVLPDGKGVIDKNAIELKPDTRTVAGVAAKLREKYGNKVDIRGPEPTKYVTEEEAKRIERDNKDVFDWVYADTEADMIYPDGTVDPNDIVNSTPQSFIRR